MLSTREVCGHTSLWTFNAFSIFELKFITSQKCLHSVYLESYKVIIFPTSKLRAFSLLIKWYHQRYTEKKDCAQIHLIC